MMDAQRIAQTVNRAIASGESLRAKPIADRRSALVAICEDLAQTDVRVLAQSTGLSQPMTAWCLDSCLRAVTGPALDALLRDKPDGSAVGLQSLVLSANVFTAPLRPVIFSVLAGVPCVLKASTRDAAFPHALATAAAKRLGCDAVVALTFGGGNPTLESPLLGRASVVRAFGHDDTLEAIAPRVTGEFIGYGSGFGAVWLDEVPTDMGALAMDVAAYDQRGCLSPHVVCVGPEVNATDIAMRLSNALADIEKDLPRGPLSDACLARQAQWRGVAAATGELIQGEHHAVALRADAPLLPGPGGRCVTVRNMDRRSFQSELDRLGSRIKALAGDTTRLRTSEHTRVSKLGEMQRPALDSVWDGVSEWQGLLLVKHQ